ncbi:DUF6575 domain-containing protein [Myroides sp. DW712]|uniref:DUF6575 domain-containing protein n=1 Tax=Myroides sp. DW712 TaxID=3389800 RepID=UPI00397B04D1
MKINNKYQIPNYTLNLNVLEAFDFQGEPILLLEQDKIGNFFISYLLDSDSEIETRSYIQVSTDKLTTILENKINIQEAFENPENEIIYIIQFNLAFGNILNTFLIPSDEVIKDFIPNNYDFKFEYNYNEISINPTQLLNYSERKNKLVFDFYLQSQNLISSIKPYALYKVFTPIIEIIKNLLEFDNRTADRYLSFSNLRHSSLGITIELNYSNDLFLEKETDALNKIIKLFTADSQEEFSNLIFSTKNNKYIKDYSTILKSIIENNAILSTAYAHPNNKEVKSAIIDVEHAKKVKLIINESLDIIEDIEVIEGIFREINIDAKEPSFKIYIDNEDVSLRGKFDPSVLEKLKSDYLNIGKERYKFILKTIYHPETSVKSEEIKRYLIEYEKLS